MHSNQFLLDPPNPKFQIIVSYFLSQSGQKASLRAGGDGKSEQSVSGEISLDQFERDFEPLGWSLSAQGLPINPDTRNAGIALKYSERLASNNPADSYRDARADDCEPLIYDAPQLFEALMADYLRITPARDAAITTHNQARAHIAADKKEAARLTKEATRAAEIERLAPAVESFLADPVLNTESSRLCSDWADIGAASETVAIYSWHPQYEQVRSAIAERKALAAQAEIDRAGRKAIQVAAWVAEQGDANQQARFAEGLLPETEVVEAMEAEAFAPVGSWSLYEKITSGDVRATCSDSCSCDSYDNCSVEFRADTADYLSADQFDKLAEMRALLPAATITPRFHKGWCGDDDCEYPAGHIERLSLQAKITMGEFVFAREFAL